MEGLDAVLHGAVVDNACTLLRRGQFGERAGVVSGAPVVVAAGGDVGQGGVEGERHHAHER